MLSIAEEEYQNTKEYILKSKKIPILDYVQNMTATANS